MAYIDFSYYQNEYHGSETSVDNFNKVAEIASIVIDSLLYCQTPVDSDRPYYGIVKRAVCYEVDTILANGGVKAAQGFSTEFVTSESVGDYSRTSQIDTSHRLDLNDIPVSPVALSLLSNAGLRNRWVHAYDDLSEEARL